MMLFVAVSLSLSPCLPHPLLFYPHKDPTNATNITVLVVVVACITCAPALTFRLGLYGVSDYRWSEILAAVDALR